MDFFKQADFEKEMRSSGRSEGSLRPSQDDFGMPWKAGADVIWEWDLSSDKVPPFSPRMPRGDWSRPPSENHPVQLLQQRWVHPEDRTRPAGVINKAIATVESYVPPSFRIIRSRYLRQSSGGESRLWWFGGIATANRLVFEALPWTSLNAAGGGGRYACRDQAVPAPCGGKIRPDFQSSRFRQGMPFFPLRFNPLANKGLWPLPLL